MAGREGLSWQHRRNKAKGLTLVELLLVIAVIALLVALWLGSSSKGLFRAKKLKDDLGDGQQSIVEMMEHDDNRQRCSASVLCEHLEITGSRKRR